MTQYTLVRHSGYALGGDSAFEDAVEVCEVDVHQVYRVRAAGGVVFATRDAAQAGENAANFPNGLHRARASAPGYFSTLRIGGAEIYVPQLGRGSGIP